MSHPPVSARTRLHGVDALRGGALLLGIVLHGLMPFMPGGLWLVADRHETPWVLAVVGPIHLFRMSLFMMIAGYFARLGLRKRGPRGFVTDRFRRLVLPLFAFWPIAVMPLGLLATLDAQRAGRVLAPPQTSGFPVGQLWFLWVLFQCVLVAVVASWTLHRTVGSTRLHGVGRRVATVLSAPGGVLLAALPYALASAGQGTAGGIEAPQTLMPAPGPLIGYLGAFAVGWAFCTEPGSLHRLSRHWPHHLAVAVAASVLVTATAVSPAVAGAVPLSVQIVVAAVGAWTWVYGLTGAATRFLREERAWVRYLADASYWMYLLHLPLLVALAIGVAGLDRPIVVKILLVWLPTVAVLLWSYDALVRDTWVGAWLNGRRYPRVLTRRRRGRDEQELRRADLH